MSQRTCCQWHVNNVVNNLLLVADRGNNRKPQGNVVFKSFSGNQSQVSLPAGKSGLEGIEMGGNYKPQSILDWWTRKSLSERIPPTTLTPHLAVLQRVKRNPGFAGLSWYSVKLNNVFLFIHSINKHRAPTAGRGLVWSVYVRTWTQVQRTSGIGTLCKWRPMKAFISLLFFLRSVTSIVLDLAATLFTKLFVDSPTPPSVVRR